MYFLTRALDAFLAPTLTVAVLGVLDVDTGRHMLSVHIRPAGITGMRHIAAGYDAVQTVEFVLAHHAPVCTPCAALRLRQKQLSPLLLGDFDLPV